MTDFVDRLETSFRTLGLEETSVLLAISGGADSVALLRGAVALREKLKLKLVAAHLNHTLRGAESEGDACFVAELCERLQVPVQIGSENIADLASAAGAGVEETARHVRYDFLKRVAADEHVAAVTTAHSADDQAETVLHHLIRGTGLAGLRGISPARAMGDSVRLVRPLLFATRAEIEAYLSELRQPYRTDSTNADESQTRSRIRRSLLPLLERDYNPQVREALVRISQQARDAQETLELLAKRFVEQAIEQRDATTCRLNADVLASLPRHLLRECFIRVWKQMNWPRQPMGFTEWERLAVLAATGGAIQLPGNIDARTRGRLIVLSRG
jgi:tRNA(Ile)-lysidine synthase